MPILGLLNEFFYSRGFPKCTTVTCHKDCSLSFFFNLFSQRNAEQFELVILAEVMATFYVYCETNSQNCAGVGGTVDASVLANFTCIVLYINIYGYGSKRVTKYCNPSRSPNLRMLLYLHIFEFIILVA